MCCFFISCRGFIGIELTKLEALDLSGMQLCQKNFEVLMTMKPKLKFLGLMFVNYHSYPGLPQLAQYVSCF